MNIEMCRETRKGLNHLNKKNKIKTPKLSLSFHMLRKVGTQLFSDYDMDIIFEKLIFID